MTPNLTCSHPPHHDQFPFSEIGQKHLLESVLQKFDSKLNFRFGVTCSSSHRRVFWRIGVLGKICFLKNNNIKNAGEISVKNLSRKKNYLEKLHAF